MTRSKRANRHRSVSFAIDNASEPIRRRVFGDDPAGRVLPEFRRSLEVQMRGDEFERQPVGFQACTDVWHASYGTNVSRAMASRSASDFMASEVIGDDDRVRIHNTDEYPFSSICMLEITAATGRAFQGTGWLVDRDTVITAGHCVYLPDQGGWAKRIRVFPGRNGGGEGTSFPAVSMHSVQGWIRDRRAQEDYGAITVRTDASDFGSLGYAVLSDKDLSQTLFHVAGYPADKPLGTLWGHVRAVREARKHTLVYETDTYGGNSGGPVFCLDDDGEVLVAGIHNYGDISGNSATRITEEVYENIGAWSH